jgi:hypothetical protein
MPRDDALTAEAYARRIERRWSKLSERAVVLSPREWAQLLAWHERGVPLEIVMQALVDVVERAQRRGAVPRLSRVATAVEAAWATVVDGRIARAADPLPGGAAAWERCCRALAPGSALAELLDPLLARLGDGESAAVIEQALEDGLCEAAPSELVQAIEAEVERELASYRTRIAADELRATRRRALIDRLRKRLGLARL